MGRASSRPETVTDPSKSAISIRSQADANCTIRFQVNSRGELDTVSNHDLSIRELRREFLGKRDTWFSVAQLVDTLPQTFQFDASLRLGGESLWSVARIGIIEELVNLLPDIQCVASAIDLAGACEIVLESSTARWRQACEIAAAARDIPLSVTQPDRATKAAPKAGRSFVSAIRLLQAMVRASRSGLRPRNSIVALD
jgi:hypothetical protein